MASLNLEKTEIFHFFSLKNKKKEAKKAFYNLTAPQNFKKF